MQRLLDIILCSLALVTLSPFLFSVIIILRLTGEGDVFYFQERVGRGGKIFRLYKFATMLRDSPNIGTKDITIQDDPRVLPVRKFLRKTKLNELPQLWNILIGDMSIVGPRPMVLKTYNYYPKTARLKLNAISPGLTGIGSIFFRDEERYLANRDDPIEFYKKHIIPYKSELELWFVENNTVLLYLKIIVATAWVIVFPSSVKMDKAFKGLPSFPDSLRLKK